MAHILVIDDDESLRTALQEFLTRFGHRVSLAADGQEGLSFLREKKADIVITDIFMPESDGLETILAIREMRRDDSVNLPVIAISGGIIGGATPFCFLQQAEIFGANRVFPKPLDFSKIENAVEELLPATG